MSNHILRNSTLIRKKWPVGLTLALLLAALGLRLYRLGAADLTFDEAASAFISGKSYPAMLAYLRQAFHELPPVYYLTLRSWSLAAGRSEYALRFPSVWFSVLSLAWLYRLGRQRLEAVSALAAVALLTVQPFHIHYAQDARPYALMMLESLLLFELFQSVRYDGRWRWWIAFGLLAITSMLTHYVMAFTLVAINLYALSELRPRPADVRTRPTGADKRRIPPHVRFGLIWFGSQAVVGSLFAVYLFSSTAARNLLRELQGFSLQSILARLEPARGMIDDLLWGVQTHPWPWWSDVAIALVAAGLLLGLVWLPRHTDDPKRLANKFASFNRYWLPIYLLIPLALVVASPERLSARYAAVLIPAYGLSLGLLIGALWRRFWPAGLAIAALLLAANLRVYSLNTHLVKSNYGRVVGYLNQHLQPGDAIILNGPWQWVQQLYYPVAPLATTADAINAGQESVHRLHSPLQPNAPVFWLPPEPLPLDPAATRQRLEAIGGQFQRAWVLPAALQDTDPQGVVRGWLNEHAYYASHYEELELYVFGQAGQPDLSQDVRADFGDAFRLRQVELSHIQAQPGQPVLVSLPLRVLRPPGGDLTIGLQLVDSAGDAWTTLTLRPGNDFHPPWQWQADDRLAAQRGLVIPGGVPPGEYSLRVSASLYPSQAVLWPSQQGQALPDPYVEIAGIQVLACTDCAAGSNQVEDTGMTPTQATFGQALNLVGVELAGQDFWQGHFVTFSLLWQPGQTLETDYRLRLSLVDSAGRTACSEDTQPVADWYPTSAWPAGQWTLDRQALLIPPRQPPGRYKLRLSVLDANDQALPLSGAQSQRLLGLFERKAALSGTALDIGQVNIRARQRVFQAGTISHPLDVTLGDSVRLLGYDWEGAPQPGQHIQLVLYWQAIREMDKPYTVFTHILAPDNSLAGQKDSWPRGSDYPTHFWVKGEVISDEYLIPFSPQAGPGQYRLMVGMYDSDTGQRLPVVQDGQVVPDNAVVLEQFSIE